MATTYLRLFPATNQFELKNGALNVGGLLRVYLNGTDDLADIYDENGTQLAQPAVLDNNGRALGLFVDAKKTYRLEVYDRYDSLIYTVNNMVPSGGGGGSSLGSQYDLVSTDGSVAIDKSVDGGRTTFDLSADKGSPEVIVTSSGERTTDGAFRFSAPTSHSGTKLAVDDGTVLSDRQFIHFEATVRLVWSSQQNAEADIQFRCMDTVESVRFDLSFPHTEFLDVSADYEVTADGTAIPVTVSGLPTGLSATVENFSVHSIARRYGEGGEYRAGNGIDIQAGVISIDPTVVQEKLEAGANISIVGNVISATAEPQQPSDWAATEGVTRILNKPDLGVYSTHSEVTYGLAQKQDTISDLATIRSGAAAGATAVQPSEMASALAGKQDVISDLPAIRSGAAKGATSVQPADLAPYAVASDVESALAGKQDVISDLSTIRSGASAGATAVQPATMNSALAGKQDVISDLNTIRSGASAGATAVQPSTMNTALAGKQDVISDLADIRSGAAAGATAVQPADMTSALAGKQDVISDLSDIRAGASAGATAVQPADMNTALADKQDVISDLSTIRSGAAAGATAVQPADMNTALAAKEDAANKSQTLDPASTTQFPSSAATASFVNSSVATNTATFRGNFKLPDLGLTYPATDAQIEAALDAHTWPVGVVPTNNDYVYVEIQNPQTTSVDDRVERYKYSDGLASWGYEYTLNNSSFTAAEIAAIDSGITAADKTAYDNHVADGTIHVTASDKTAWDGKQDAIGDLNTIRSGASAGATAVQPGDLATVATSGNYSDLNGKPTLFSGDYDDLTGKPDLSVYAESADLAAVATSGAYADLSGKPDLSVYAQSADLATVATTGSYDDLSDKPTIPAAQVNADWNAASGVAQILNKPTLAAVATSGAYADLSGTPTINNVPAVTPSDDNKVLKASYSGGGGSYSWEQAPASQVQSDWTEADPAAASYIENKPVPKALVAGTNVSISETANSLTISASTGPTYTAGDGIKISNQNVISKDETVLWEDTNGATSAQLSESIFNFETIKIFYAGGERYGNRPSMELAVTSSVLNNGIQISDWFINSAGTFVVMANGYYTVSQTGDELTGSNITHMWFSVPNFTYSGTGSSGVKIFKVVGIHRVASNQGE